MEDEMLAITKMASNFRITIPSEARAFLKIKPKQKIIVCKINNEIVLRKA